MYIIIGFNLLTLLTTPSVLVRSARVASLAMKGEARISSLVHYALTAQTLIQLHVAPHRKQLNEQLPKLRSNATCIQRIESDCRITRYIIMKGERAYRTDKLIALDDPDAYTSSRYKCRKRITH